jgi:archaemetzincin
LTSEELALVQVRLRLDSQLEQLIPVLVKRLLNINPVLLPPLTNIKEAFDSTRNQYHSTRIIASLESEIDLNSSRKIMGITSLHLYNPGMDGQGFVFGEARCPRRVGVVSTARLETTLHDKPNTFENRVRKEVIHEIGHVKGLKHCSSPLCVMHSSTSVADADMKTDDHCNNCRVELGT